MKNIGLSILLGITLIACVPTNKQAINSKDLVGKYEVDLNSVLNNWEEDCDSTEVGVALGAFAMLLFNSQITMQFEEQKLLIDGTGTFFRLMWAFEEETDELPIVLDYKIKQDSLLYTRSHSEEAFQKVGVLRKMSDSYDYLQYKPLNEDSKKSFTFILRKLQTE